MREPFRELVFTFPPGGLASGLLIVLGPTARWPVMVGVAIAAYAHIQFLPFTRPIGEILAFIIGDVAQVLIIAGLIEQFFGRNFGLERLRHVLGLFAAAIISCFVVAVFWAITFKLFFIPTAPFLTIWQHWFTGLLTGVVSVTPLIIGLGAMLRNPPSRGELLEAAAAIGALALMTGIVVLLPPELWETVLPAALLFRILAWLAVRCRPVFAAAGVFIASSQIIWMTIYGFGHFGQNELSIDNRIVQSQAIIMLVAVGTCVLAALFTERKESEARLALSKLSLERERDNKLMNAQAITASIAHEIRQPMAAIAVNAAAALRFLGQDPPSYEDVRETLSDIRSATERTSEVLDGLRILFGKVDQERQPVDMNTVIRDVLQSLHTELINGGVDARHELMVTLPRVDGNRGQLQQVIFNLVNNAIEAMASTPNRTRILRVRTEFRRDQAIAVSVQDTGPGIDPKQLDSIFGVFVTTKARGTGLGLAICRMIIEHHGGELTATSDGKSGALFQFVLPTGSETRTASGQ